MSRVVIDYLVLRRGRKKKKKEKKNRNETKEKRMKRMGREEREASEKRGLPQGKFSLYRLINGDR